jgi:biopolymer transport protein TolR
MSMAVGEKGGTIADINVTPMADVMIVLLIIFMVVTPMISKGVDVNLPKAAKKSEGQAVEVAIRRDSVLFLGGVKVDGPTDLRDKVKQRIEDLPEGGKIIQLKADVELPYAEVMKVMDLVRDVGVEEVALIAEKKVEG